MSATEQWKSGVMHGVDMPGIFAVERLMNKLNIPIDKRYEFITAAGAPWSLEYEKIKDQLEPEIERVKKDIERRDALEKKKKRRLSD